ncbi:MAG: methylenetetrahydrofolate--tRNA-(uracil(54)-C(5))-methyltransferase (FADH(2)-oxidizing) TrmFO [Clostridiaceae bacterium]|nr:methylenetetrahydrofolate--tRNA-(uracil(54)-C(5))-methyltransferase (FADH(2)-oxidizing) TrmFO [Clostridiaceae bacterium]
MKVNIIGAGLAGCEAAWQIAKRGGKVALFEMKPIKKTPAHQLDTFAELVCSNSLRSNQLENAVGLLKEELRSMGSVVMQCADQNAIPAGGALAVDRERFSLSVTEMIRNHPNIEVYEEEVTNIDPQKITIISTGPLTSDALSETISGIIGEASLSFFDAAAPIVKAESINMDIAFFASRYNKGTSDYINCPMSRDEYLSFYDALIHAETAEIKDFEKKHIFEGCMPVEVMAARGVDTLLFGPLKPVGLINPHNGKQPYAVVQLRQDNREGTLYNLVGFQTNLKWGEQKRVFSMIPGLENAEFARYGVMHRNTFINSPKLLTPSYRFKKRDHLYFAGQITGVEGYVESIASGLVAGINAYRTTAGMEELVFPASTAIGALAHYISTSSMGNFQPMNINFGIMDTKDSPVHSKTNVGKKVTARQKKQEKNLQIANRALKMIQLLKDN